MNASATRPPKRPKPNCIEWQYRLRLAEQQLAEAQGALRDQIEHNQALADQLQFSEIAAGRAVVEAANLRHALAVVEGNVAHIVQLAWAVRRMFIGVKPTGHWVETNNGRRFINVRELNF